MNLIALACQQCGAPLEVPPETSFVTCRHCGAALAVRRNESVVFTERLDRLDRQTNELAEWIAEREYQEALLQARREYRQAVKTLDAHWARYCGPWVPASGGLLLIAAFTMMAFSLEIVVLVPQYWIVGCCLLLGSFVLIFLQRVRGQDYRHNLKAYRLRRAALRLEQFLPPEYSRPA